MTTRSPAAFFFRVRVVLALVVVYLLVLAGLHGISLLSAQRRLEREVAARARTAADSVVAVMGQEALRAKLRAWRSRGTPPGRLPLTLHFREVNAIAEVVLLTPEGWRLDDSGAGQPRHRALTAEERRRLAEGVPVVDVRPAEFEGIEAATVRILHPILDWDGTLLGLVAADVRATALAEAHADVKRNLLLQAAGLVAFLALLLLFTRWMLRPVALLAASTRAGDPAAVLAAAAHDDSGFVIETYRQVIAELQEKEAELRRLREVERHRADEQEDLNASIVGSLVSGILVLDLSGRVASLNEAARETLRLDPDRVVGRPHGEVLAHLPEVSSRVSACLEGASVVRREDVRVGLPGVGRRDLGLTISPLRARDGARAGALCLVSDLTEVKRLQEQVRLKESLAELGELSAGIAHEFRNALATILGFASLVEKTTEGEAREHGAAIKAEVASLRAVVDDFLRFANPTRLVIESIDLRAMLETCRDEALRRGQSSASLTIEGARPTLTGDETLLRRVFTNLMRNAVDATEGAGTVRALVEAFPGLVHVHVDDDGPGVLPEDRDKLFVPFFTRKAAGTGLGLALARKVVVHHGGEIAASTSPLGGARFTVTLPSRTDDRGA